MRLLSIFLSASLMAGAASAAQKSGTASGFLMVNGKKYELKYAIAKSDTNAFDEKKKDTVVLLSDLPVDATTFGSDAKIAEAASNGKFHGIVVTLEDGTTPYHLSVFADKVQSQISGNIFDFKPAAGDGIGGRFFTASTESLGSAKYAYDVTFRADVQEIAPPPGAAEPPTIDSKNGTRLPPNAGEPGAAFLAMDKAIAAGDLKKMQKLRSKSSRDNMPMPASEKDTKEMIAFLQAMHPKHVKIVEGYANATDATLTVSGDDPFEPAKKAKGTVHLTKEADGWKIDRESWSN